MTLAPVFRSSEALGLLESKGYLELLEPSIAAEREYARTLRALLNDVINDCYIADAEGDEGDISFLQRHFFLILFDSVYRSLGCTSQQLETYGLLNLCIKGLVVAGDNLFDGEAKMELPLDLGPGCRFQSIVQLLSFDHLIMRVTERDGCSLDGKSAIRFRRELLSCLATIGALEGSEESGVRDIPPVDKMIEDVHRVRGGELFSLAFIAPQITHGQDETERWRTARTGVSRLGTAFQIVDDLTDFEFDLTRGSHNVLAAQIVHMGTEEEQAAFGSMRAQDANHSLPVETTFAHSAGAVLTRACREAEQGFEDLRSIGFWYPPSDAELFIRAIAGDAGDSRMRALAGASGTGRD